MKMSIKDSSSPSITANGSENGNLKLFITIYSDKWRGKKQNKTFWAAASEGTTDRPTDTAYYRDARTHLKT